MIDASPAARIGEAIAGTGLATALRESIWLYPTVETIHIVGFALLFGSIVVVDVRLLGAGRRLPLGPLLRFVLPVTWSSTLLVVPTGVLLFVAHATDLIGNPAFVAKVVLLSPPWSTPRCSMRDRRGARSRRRTAGRRRRRHGSSPRCRSDCGRP